MKLTLPSLIFLLILVPGQLVGQVTPSKEEFERFMREAVIFEERQSEKLLGVPVQKFPDPQGLGGFDDLPANRPALRFSVVERRPTGPGPRPSFELRSIVKAKAPNGTVYEAYTGRDQDELVPNHGFVSTSRNTRQMYGTHHGYVYNPQDVYIGKRVGSRLKPTLFFRDVGSHATAPHHFAIDNKGMVHLVVADVNNFQDNQLDVYWVVGNPESGKWTAAWLIDRRGFTSWSHPWSASWGTKIDVLWNWCDESINKDDPGMGVFHLQWEAGGFGRKLRVVKGVPSSWDAAVDPQTGRLLLVYVNAGLVYVTSRSETGSWTRATLLNQQLKEIDSVLVRTADDGSFIVRTGSENTREWLVGL